MHIHRLILIGRPYQELEIKKKIRRIKYIVNKYEFLTMYKEKKMRLYKER